MVDGAFPQFAAVALVFLMAGIVKGVIGMGLPTIAMGMLGILMPLPHAAALLTLPAFVTNVWQAAAGPATRAVLRRFALLQVAIAAGVAFAAVLMPPHADESLGHALLGGCLLAYGLTGLAGWRVCPPKPGWQVPVEAVVGVVTGALTGMTGVYVLPLVPYLQSLQLERRTLAQALGLCFTTSTVALAGLLALRGAVDARSSAASAFLLVPALAGMALGQRLRDAMSERTFRTCFFAGLAALGALSLALAR